jgi:hypothetical protein
MNVLDVDLQSEDNIILKLDDLYTRCDNLKAKIQSDPRLLQKWKGSNVVSMLSQQTDLILDYTMIIPELTAMKNLMEAYLKKIATIIQKNLVSTSQRAYGDRELVRLIEGDNKILFWTQHKIQLEQLEGEFKALSSALVTRGFSLRNISEMHINEKGDVVI